LVIDKLWEIRLRMDLEMFSGFKIGQLDKSMGYYSQQEGILTGGESWLMRSTKQYAKLGEQKGPVSALNNTSIGTGG